MRVFAIYDQDLNRKDAIGFLFCYEKSNEFVIELCDDLTEWESPLLFQELVKKGIRTIPKGISILWVRERVIPSGRQNIGMILKNAKLKEYNERSLLALSGGRCSQDNCFVAEISEQDVPDDIIKRSDANVSECFLSGSEHIICLFRDDKTCKIDLGVLAKENKDIQKILVNKKLIESVRVGVGGYSIVFSNDVEISKDTLREKRWDLSVKASDFHNFVENNLVSSSKACENMECSKQNLSYYVKAKKIEPIIYGSKENFYTKGSVQKLIDD